MLVMSIYYKLIPDIVYNYTAIPYRGGETGPVDLANAEPNFDRNPQFKYFCFK